jgi:hypothetical protein
LQSLKLQYDVGGAGERRIFHPKRRFYPTLMGKYVGAPDWKPGQHLEERGEQRLEFNELIGYTGFLVCTIV